MRRWLLLAAIVTVGALALIVGACAGGDDSDDNATTSPPPSGDGSGAPPSSSGQLPAEFVSAWPIKGSRSSRLPTSIRHRRRCSKRASGPFTKAADKP